VDIEVGVEPNMQQNKLLIISIDGATYNVIEPLIEAGELPNLRRLIESGSKTKLLSTLHPMSPQAWTTFHTGVNPWKHGILDFSSLDVGQPFSPMRWHNIRVVSILELLDRAGIHAIWNNLLGAYPFPKLRNGIVVGGRMTPKDDALIYPEYLQRDVEQLFPQGYEMNIDLSQLAVDGEVSETAVLSKLLSHTEHQARLTTNLMRTQSWDLCFVMLDATDIGQHLFWQYLDDNHPDHEADAPDELKQAITTIYRKVDESIGELLEVTPEETNVLVLSDHGFGPLYATVNLNGFLVSAGYTVPMHRYHPKRLLSMASSILMRRRPKPIYQNPKINWKKTTVYAHGYMGNLFVNLKGREPEGSVPLQEYEKVIQGVIENLHRWKNPVTGAPMVRTVHRSPFPMNQQHNTRGIPDLLVEWFDYRYAGIHAGNFDRDFELGSPHFSYNLLRSADHTLEGILICSGPDFKPLESNAHGNEVSICDMAPLIMTLMRLPLHDHFDGRVPTGLLRPEVGNKSVQREPLEHDNLSTHQVDYSKDELSEIADRLRALGYLE